jgi:serine protease Do
MHRGLLSTIAFALLAAPASAAEPPQLRELEQHVRKVIEEAERSVVAVVVSHQKYPDPSPDRASGRLGRYQPKERNPRVPWSPPPPSTARLDLSDPQYVADHQFGSGLVLGSLPGTSTALVLTSYHLTDGATKIYVRSSSGKGCYADIHAADARSDLAVLRLLDPLPGLAPVAFADVRVADGPGDAKATVYRGMGVIALGHPMATGFADGAASASWGLLSNVRRKAAGPAREDARYRTERGLHHYGSLLQTDARIALGCSGGGLFDLDGKLVGMTAPLAAVTGTDTAGGYAIPFDQNYRRIIAALRSGREVEYGFLGVGIGEPPSLRPLPAAPPAGVWIGTVTPGSPAAAVGLVGQDRLSPQDADIILAVDGQPVRDADDLFLHVGSALAGNKVTLSVWRSGQRRDVGVTLVKHYNPMPWLASDRPRSVFGVRVDYASTLVGLTQAAGGIGGAIEDGVLIREIEPDSPAAGVDRLVGNGGQRWLVTQVNGRQVSTPAEFYREAAGKAFVRLRLHDPNPSAADRDPVIELPGPSFPQPPPNRP